MSRHAFWFVTVVYAWSALLFAGALALGGCAAQRPPDLPLPREAPCRDYEAQILSVDDVDIIPSITPAPMGVRVIVDADVRPFMGASAPVPGGRMVWVVWVYRWWDGDHLGAIGRVGDTATCRWYDPL